MKPPMYLTTTRQFVNVQIPMADLRVLLNHPTGRLSRPSWPDPIAGREFVRGVGVIADLNPYRSPGRPAGLVGMHGERNYCEGSQLLRFVDQQSDEDLSWRLIHRRLFHTGVSWRLDIGLTTRWGFEKHAPRHSRVFGKIDSAAAARLMYGGRKPTRTLGERILQRAVKVGHGRYILHSAGDAVARHLLAATTANGAGEQMPASWWMASGRPFVLVDEYNDRIHDVTASVETIRISKQSFVCVFLQHGYQRGGYSRSLRISIWRAYQELETLRQVIRAWRAHPADFSRSSLRDYLARQLRLLAKRTRNNLDQTTLFSLFSDVVGFEDSDLFALADEMRRYSKGIYRSLTSLIESLDSARADSQQPAQVTHNYLVVRGGLRMQGDRYSFKGPAAGVFGDGNQISGSSFVGHQTNVSLATQELLHSLEELIPTLTEKRRRRTDEAVTELKNAQGDRHRIKAILAKISAIAVTAGELGAPVIEAIRKLAAALGI
ncbi:hypothetical protein AB0H43_13390 [Hamadaea sp. NPDC050747]|uniref:hypothetical protein n=1 Tax=Hamadaea sp. NPDC050747 TaxID=3155789 RepID=UPI0033CF9D81